MTRCIDVCIGRLAGLLKTHGGSVVYGGDSSVKDKYIQPTILRISKDSPAMAEETFGPILLVCMCVYVVYMYMYERGSNEINVPGCCGGRRDRGH